MMIRPMPGTQNGIMPVMLISFELFQVGIRCGVKAGNFLQQLNQVVTITGACRQYSVVYESTLVPPVRWWAVITDGMLEGCAFRDPWT